MAWQKYLSLMEVLKASGKKVNLKKLLSVKGSGIETLIRRCMGMDEDYAFEEEAIDRLQKDVVQSHLEADAAFARAQARLPSPSFNKPRPMILQPPRKRLRTRTATAGSTHKNKKEMLTGDFNAITSRTTGGLDPFLTNDGDDTTSIISTTAVREDLDRVLISNAKAKLKEGIEDTVQNLLECAILRAFVPDTMPPSTSCDEAYRWYLDLPPCRLKIVHEQQALQKAQRYAQNLGYEGFKIIKDLIPLSRYKYVLEQLHMRKELVAACHEIIQAILSTRPASCNNRKVRYDPSKNCSTPHILEKR